MTGLTWVSSSIFPGTGNGGARKRLNKARPLPLGTLLEDVFGGEYGEVGADNVPPTLHPGVLSVVVGRLPHGIRGLASQRASAEPGSCRLTVLTREPPGTD